jgi:hypothetical protein
MSDDKDKQQTDTDAELEREIRKGRKFTVAEAIGRMAGPGAMKGVSPITLKQQTMVAIENWLRQHMCASEGELQTILLRRIGASELLLHCYERPLFLLAACCQKVLDSEYLLKDLVNEADVEWGQVQGERPHFDREGLAPDLDDPYTIESVRSALTGLVEQVAAEGT